MMKLSLRQLVLAVVALTVISASVYVLSSSGIHPQLDFSLKTLRHQNDNENLRHQYDSGNMNHQHDNGNLDPQYGNEPTAHFAIVTCKDVSANKQPREHWDHQLRQIKVLLKSAALLTNTGIHINIITNTEEAYDDVIGLTKKWPLRYQKKLILSDRKEVYYPEELKNLEDMFARCSTERLFLPFALSDMDAVIFLDTDTLFMQPPEDLWEEFANFDNRQVIGVTPCLYMYDDLSKKGMPTYSFSGLNAGVLLYNLTRIRRFPGGDWVTSISEVIKNKNYNTFLKYGDQDILNILFSGQNTPLAYEVGCEWNYRHRVCSKDRNRCPNAASRGVALLHGAATSFVNDEAPNIKAVFEGWEKYNLDSPTSELLSLLKEGLQKAKQSNKGCFKISNIDDILLKGLRRSLAKRKCKCSNLS